MNFDESELRNMLIWASDLGSTQTLIKTGKLKPYLKQKEAFDMYGRATVERWIKEGLITPEKDGLAKNSMVRLDRVRLEALSKTSNRHTYLSVEERKK